MRKYLILCLFLLPTLCVAQGLPRTTFTTNQRRATTEEEELKRRRANPVPATPAHPQEPALVPVVIDGRIVYVPPGKTILTPTAPAPRHQHNF